MDRLSLIKQAHANLQPKKAPYRPRVISTGTPRTPEEIKKRRMDLQKAREKAREELKICLRCSRPAVLVSYEYDGVLLMSWKAKYCPYHWEAESVRVQMLAKVSEVKK